MAAQITTNEELAVLLGTLGDTADAIAANLRAQDIKGFPGKGEQCPVANWLLREVQDVKRVEVHPYDVELRVELRVGVACTYLTCEVPTPVEGFVEDFDEGCYPDLIDPAADR